MFSYAHERDYEMSRPVIGIMGNFYLINDQYPAHAAGTMNCEAIVDYAMQLLLLYQVTRGS